MSISIGTPLSSSSFKAMLLGSGELGKEVALELQRIGVEVIAVDRYPNAPAMQVAHRYHVINMLERDELRHIVELESPDLIIPEIEAIATETLVELEAEGLKVIPSANAANLTMNREGIRRLAAEDLDVLTSRYMFCDTQEQYLAAIEDIGLPCVVKPVMSSSGKGQSTVSSDKDVPSAWEYAKSGARGEASKVIVEGFVDFDYEITLLTVQHAGGCSFCEPIGHRQEGGDYQESWQPQSMSDMALENCQRIAEKVTSALGGYGLFGVEFFVKGDVVYFSEVSPRPHDTGMVTMISQDLSEFSLHVRAVLGLPIPNIRFKGPSASSVILVHGESNQVEFQNVDQALAEPDTQIRLFGKPEVLGERRMGVCLAMGRTVDEARRKANFAASKITSRT